MDVSLILSNILNPPVLAFFLGILAVFVKSDLEIPAPLPKLFSLYLLFAIGFKGGVELIKSGLNQDVVLTLIAVDKIKYPVVGDLYYSEYCPRPIILFIDEIDSLENEVLISILRPDRDGYNNRPKNFPSSIGLIGMRSGTRL